jgi:hypothetical protein
MLLEPEEIIIIMHILRMYRKRNKRKLWVHPVFESRLSKGAFYTLHGDLCSDELQNV